MIGFPGADVFFILLCHAYDIDITIYLETRTGKKRQLINVSEKRKGFGKEWCKILLGVYVFKMSKGIWRKSSV